MCIYGITFSTQTHSHTTAFSLTHTCRATMHTHIHTYAHNRHTITRAHKHTNPKTHTGIHTSTHRTMHMKHTHTYTITHANIHKHTYNNRHIPARTHSYTHIILWLRIALLFLQLLKKFKINAFSFNLDNRSYYGAGETTSAIRAIRT